MHGSHGGSRERVPFIYNLVATKIHQGHADKHLLFFGIESNPQYHIIKKTSSGNCAIRSQRRLAPTSVAPVTTTITDSGHTHIKNTYESVNQTNSHATRFNMSCCTWLPSLSQIRARVHCANSGRETCGEVSPARQNQWRLGDLGATTAMPIALKLGGGLDVIIQDIPITPLVHARATKACRNPRAVFSLLMTWHSSHSP